MKVFILAICALFVGCASVENRTTPRDDRGAVLGGIVHKIGLSNSVNEFVQEAMPQVGRERNALLQKYSKINKKYSDLVRICADTNSSTTRKLCEKEKELVLYKLKVFAKKLCELDEDIERVYVKYKMSSKEEAADEALLDAIDGLSAKISRIDMEVRGLGQPKN